MAMQWAVGWNWRLPAISASPRRMPPSRLWRYGAGSFPGGGATWRLAPLVGKGWAMEMILSGEPIDARTAERIGLVNHVVPQGELMKTTRALAEKIAGWSPAAVMLAKQAVNQAGAAQEASGFNIGVALRALAETNEDRISATRAFVEKKVRGRK